MISKPRLEALDAGLKLAGVEMSIPLLRTLIAVALNQNQSVTELAELIGAPQQTASRYISVLQGRYQTADASSVFSREPLIVQKPSASDLRRYELHLTTRGAAKLEAILDRIFAKEGTL